MFVVRLREIPESQNCIASSKSNLSSVQRASSYAIYVATLRGQLVNDLHLFCHLTANNLTILCHSPNLESTIIEQCQLISIILANIGNLKISNLPLVVSPIFTRWCASNRKQSSPMLSMYQRIDRFIFRQLCNIPNQKLCPR